MVQRLSLLHNFIHQSLNSGSAQVQILLTACPKFVIRKSLTMILAGNKAKRLSSVNHTKKQFITIIITIIIIFFEVVNLSQKKFISTSMVIECPELLMSRLVQGIFTNENVKNILCCTILVANRFIDGPTLFRPSY